jgi:hypothetical protein
MAESARTSQSRDSAPLTTVNLLDRLSRFQGPPEQFLLTLLAVQCQLARAAAGAILRLGRDGRPEVLSVYPPLEKGSTAPVWLAQAAEQAARVIESAATAVAALHTAESLYGQPAQEHVILVPLTSATLQGVRGVEAFHLEAGNPAAVAAAVERLEMTSSLLSLYEMRLTLQRRQYDLQRLSTAINVMAAVNEHEKFSAASMTFCNEAASAYGAERVSFGVLKNRYVHVKATSHTEKFSRKMELIQHIESAMEECLDQDLEVLHPAPPESSIVSRATGELAQRHGPSAIVSLPLRHEDKPVAVLTLERSTDKPFGLEEIESARLLCNLASPRLMNLYARDRWFGARAAATCRKGLAVLLGPEKTWIKLVVIGVLAAALFVTFVKGAYQAKAPVVLQATEQQVVPAPFDGFLKEVYVEPGDAVVGGKTVLAQLDTADLRLQQASAMAERATHVQESAKAMGEAKIAEAQIADAAANKATAQIDLLTHRIEQARIVAPVDGVVLTGDLKRQLGSPVQTGKTLFEVAPVQALRAELSVPESEIADMKVGQEGEFIATAMPSTHVRFIVERIDPVAVVLKQHNVYTARARLVGDVPTELRPGMEGLAKVSIGQRRYAWLWTRSLRNWLRMKLWF